MTYVDFKVTTWYRVKIDKSISRHVEYITKIGKINNLDYFYQFFNEDDFTVEEIEGVSEQMTTSENGGYSTIELYDGEKLLWDNTMEEINE